MSGPDDMTAFEQRLRELLAETAGTASGRVRSRLTQARYAALTRAGHTGRAWRALWPARLVWLPAAGALLVAAVWVTLWVPRHDVTPPFASDSAVVTTADMTMLTDRDGLALVEGGNGQFYEWALAQARRAGSAAVDEPGKNGD